MAKDSVDAAAAAAEEEDEETRSKPTDSNSGGGGGGVSSTAIAVGNDHAERASKRPMCYESSRRSDTCEAAGDVRVVGRAQTVLVSTLEREWKVKPYYRKHDAFALSHVKEWTLRSVDGNADKVPRCSVNSTVATTFVLSTGGFSGNLFHD